MKAPIKILLILFALFASAFGDDITIDQIKERGYLRVAVLGDRAPFSVMDKDGKAHGFDAAFAYAFAKELFGDESKVRFIAVKPSSRADILANGSVDIALAGYTVTDERKRYVDFADPYMKTAIGVVSSAKDTIVNLGQLRGKRLIVIRATTAEAYFTRNYPEIKLVRYYQISDAYNALLAGEGDALAEDNTVLFQWAREHPDYKVGIKFLGDDEPIAPAVNKGNRELLAWINKTLAKLRDDGFHLKAFETELRPHYGNWVKPEDVLY